MRVAVLGIGSLGAFVAQSISYYTDSVEELVLVDHDIVEEKNLINSIYRRIDIGMPKVYALENIIRSENADIKIQLRNEKFIEGESELPSCALVIDCRDFIYDRSGLIDVRLSISSRHLVIDCKRIVNYKNQYEGRYRETLTKGDIRSGAIDVAKLIQSKGIFELIRKQAIHNIDLDGAAVNALTTIQEVSNDCDVVCNIDDFEKGETFVNLPDKFHPIVHANKSKDVMVCLNSLESPTISKLIKMDQLRTYEDVVDEFQPMVETKFGAKQFFIEAFERNGVFVVVLLPETGGA